MDNSMSLQDPLIEQRPDRKPRRVIALLNASSGTTAGKKRDDLNGQLQAAFEQDG